MVMNVCVYEGVLMGRISCTDAKKMIMSMWSQKG